MNLSRLCPLRWWAKAFDSELVFTTLKRLCEVIFHIINSLSESSNLAMSSSFVKFVLALWSSMIPRSTSNFISWSSCFHACQPICGQYLLWLHHSQETPVNLLLDLSLLIFDDDLLVFCFLFAFWVFCLIVWSLRQFVSDFVATLSFFHLKWLVKIWTILVKFEFFWIMWW